MITDQKPIKSHSKDTELKDGTSVTVQGEVFSNPIFPGEMVVFNMVKIIRKSDGVVMGCPFYQDMFTDEELKDKVNEVAEHVDQWLGPAFKNG